MEQNKVCTKCKVSKGKEQFNKDKRTSDGLTYHCKVCVREYTLKSRIYTDLEYRNKHSTDWKKENPQKVRQQQIKHVYNLSWEQYENMFKSQEGSCALCQTPLKLHKGIEHGTEVAVVDHCHTTGQVRGLLCKNCNTALGLFKDNKDVLKKAFKYLETKQ